VEIKCQLDATDDFYCARAQAVLRIYPTNSLSTCSVQRM